MKKVSQIMKELGFRPEGSDEVKKAFIKNLIQQANIQENRRNPQELASIRDESVVIDDVPKEQLSLFTKKRSS